VLIIALTAAAFTEDGKARMADGMDEVLHKPMSHDRLIAAVERHGWPRPDVTVRLAPGSNVVPRMPEDPAVSSPLGRQFYDMWAMLGDDEMAGIIELYIRTAEELLPIVIDADRDSGEREEAAHALKGASDMIGLDEIRTLCCGVMLALRDNRAGELQNKLSSLPLRIADTCTLLKSTLQRTM